MNEKALQTRSPNDMTDLFEELFGGVPGMRLPMPDRAWAPRVNVHETEREYVLSVGLPGVKREDVKLNVHDGILTIQGEQRTEKDEKGKTWLRHEIHYGSFRRSFILPEGVHPEQLKAAYKEGMLTVTLPKPQPGKQRGVDIKVD